MRVLVIGLWIGLGLSPLPGTAAGGRQSVRLLESAGAAGEAVRLSDLLPQGASQALRVVGQGMALGAAPKLGSSRVFRKDQIARALSTNPWLLEQISIPEQVSVHRAAWPVPGTAVRQTVEEFLAKPGWKEHSLDLDRLQWPGEILSLVPWPRLQIVRAAWNPQRRAEEFVMRCSLRQWCGAFLVQLPAGPAEEHSWRKLQSTLYRRTRGRLDGRDSSLPLLVRAGDRCRLSLQNEEVHISLPVLCLQRGSLGDTVRVRDPSNQRVLRGEVTGERKIRGAF